MTYSVSETLMAESLPADLIPHLVAAELFVEGAAQPNVFRELFTEDTTLVGKNGIKLSVPYISAAFTATTISESTLDSSGYTPTDLTILDTDVTIGNQVYVAWRLSDILLEDQPNVSWLRVHLRDASRAISEYVDAALKAVVIGGTGETNSAATFGILDKDDIIDILAEMKNKDYYPADIAPYLVLNPDQESDLLKDADFANTVRYKAGSLSQMVAEGPDEPLWAGCRIRVTSGMTKALALIAFKTDNRGAATSVFAVKRPETVRSEREELYGRQLWAESMRYGAAILSASSIGLISGC